MPSIHPEVHLPSQRPTQTTAPSVDLSASISESPPKNGSMDGTGRQAMLAAIVLCGALLTLSPLLIWRCVARKGRQRLALLAGVDVQDEPDLAIDEARPAAETESDVAEVTQEKTSTRAGIPAVLTVTGIKKQSHVELTEIGDR